MNRDFATSSFVGEHHKDRLLDDTLQEQKRVSNQLKGIKWTLMDIAYAAEGTDVEGGWTKDNYGGHRGKGRDGE